MSVAECPPADLVDVREASIECRHPSPSDSPARSKGALSVTGAINILLLSIAGFWFTKNDVDADLWGHVRFGEDLWRTRTLPTIDPYSYAAGDRLWINHEIGAELFLAWLARHGNWAIQLAKFALGIGSVLIAATMSRRQRIGALPQLLLYSAIIATLSWGWSSRPQLLSYFCFVLLLWIIERGARSTAWLWLSIPLMTLWANCHGGFLFGLGLLGLYLCARMGRDLLSKPSDPAQVRLARVATLSLIGVGAVAATWINPYGAGLYQGLVDELGIPRPQIAEWLPLSWTSTALLPAHLLIVYALAATLFTKESLAVEKRLLVLVMVIEAQLHVRHIPFLALATLAWLPGHVQSSVERVLTNGSTWSGFVAFGPRPAPRFAVFCVSVVAIVLGIVSVDRLRSIDVPRDRYPVDALEFAASRGLKGRMVTPFSWGEYALAALGPEIKVSFDGRYGTTYDQETIDLNFDLWYPDDARVRYRSPKSPPFDPRAVLRRGDPNLALIDRVGFPQAERVMNEASAEWIVLYQDPLASIWGRRDVYDDPRSPARLPAERRVARSTIARESVPFPALPRPAIVTR